jgi:hypothetical protein
MSVLFAAYVHDDAASTAELAVIVRQKTKDIPAQPSKPKANGRKT